ncbi:MAG: hypothetical protein ABEH77_01245 [Halobacteriaceae archaeon]
MSGSDGYRGALGAFPYAVRASDSWLFRSYAVVGGLVAAFAAAVFAFGLVGLLGSTAGVTGGTFALSRAFFVVVALLVVAPLVAPVLLVARRHRLGYGRPGYDRALAAAGYLFVVALYAALVVTTPPGLREPPSGVLAPLVRALYAADPALAALPLAVGAASVVIAHRRYR